METAIYDLLTWYDIMTNYMLFVVKYLSAWKLELCRCWHVKDDRRAELGGKADKARNVVSDLTSAIEQMRLVRDQKMADINRAQLKIEVSTVINGPT